jgi:hypothetical protein
MKRQPTLADLALAQAPLQPTLVASSWREQTRDWLRLAKRFVLDEQAAVYLGRMIRQSPRVIADAQDFAIPAFENMWVEMPAIPFLQAIGSATSTAYDDPTTDSRIGYLLNGPRVRVLSESLQGYVAVMPLEYRLHQPMTESEELALGEALGVSRIQLDFWFWGSSAMKYLGALCTNEDPEYTAAHEWDRAGLRALRANHSVRTAPAAPGTRPLKDLDSKGSLIYGSGGDLRNIVALLLFMNRTANITTLDGVPMGEGFIARKPRPLLSHRVIKLKLDPLPRLMRLCAGLGVKRRLHDVRGHFCHDRIARELGCPHGQEHEGDFGDWWEETEPLRWRCTGCHGKRWWRHEHKRGDAKTGATVQEYEVTK